MISQKDPKSKGIEGAFMEKSEMRKLAEFIEKLSWDDLPEEVKTTVSFRVLDLISAALGAVDDPLVKKVKASYLERNNGTGGKIWGSKGETDISTAAYINAMLAHTLELDDVHPASKTHGSASLIPAAWSCARYVHASGKEFLTAVVCGYETVSRIGGDRFHVLIGIDDSSSEDCIQKNEIAYLQARLRAGDVILSGVDDLAFKAVTKLYLSEIGWNGAQVNVQYFGGTKDRPACDYDYKPLTEIVAEHLDYFGLTVEDTPAFADLYVLVLTQPEDAAQKQQYIQELTATLNERLKADLPVILIDASNGQYGTVFHDALTKKAELGKLLSYAGFLDMAIVTGTALSHGVARYAHLIQGRTSQAEEVAFCKTLADSILKDFCYKNVVREDILSYVRNDLGGDANNFCLPELDRPAIVDRLTTEMDKATAPVLKNLERSSLLIGLKPHVDTVTAHWGKIGLSNYRFPWNRAFEIDMDISVDPLTR